MFDWLRARLEREEKLVTTDSGRVRYYVDPPSEELVGQLTWWDATGQRCLRVNLDRMTAQSFDPRNRWKVRLRGGVLVGNGPLAGLKPDALRTYARGVIGWA